MSEPQLTFSALDLPPHILKAIAELGYEQPSPIQAKAIPTLLEGGDMIGQAQTGTGKTAAFALPLLAKLTSKPVTQALVLAPTRELAIQVAEACQSYAKHMDNFTVLPIYGGQSYTQQLRQLKRGAQLVVGTPGRVMDHMRRGTLKLDALDILVLDEADEMLRMGFIDDVTWVLEQTPESRQIALFSATMPKEIKRVAQNHLTDPTHVKIESTTSTAKTIRQRYWPVQGLQKLDALTRIMEVEDYDGVIIFVRTKLATEELANKLNARGFASAALHGDIPQAAREKTVDRLKAGKIDFLVATDVVARGLDVERVSHVINFDIPYDTEAYVHRIGRTGRAGRSGDAILFVANRERRMLRAIERATGQIIDKMKIPTAADINEKRVVSFKASIMETLESKNLELYQDVLQELVRETQADPVNIAAALAHLAQGGRPLLLDPRQDTNINRDDDFEDRRGRDGREGRKDKGRDRKREGRRGKEGGPVEGPIRPLKDHPDVALERFCIDVGREQGITPAQVVGAIANTADMSSEYIGQIEIYDSVTTVDLPEGMPTSLKKLLTKTRLGNKPLVLRKLSESKGPAKSKEGGKFSGKSNPSGKPKHSGKPNKSDKSDKKRKSSKDGKRGGPANPKFGDKGGNKSEGKGGNFDKGKPSKRAKSEGKSGSAERKPRKRPVSKD